MNSHIRLILGDQLTHSLSSLRDAVPASDIILMAEVRTEATYVKHHKKKIALIFSAMRHFAEELRARGFTVRYTRYDDPENAGSLLSELRRMITPDTKTVTVTEAAEFRLLAEMHNWQDTLGIPVRILSDDRFLATPQEFATWANGRKQLRMEFFYREMRRKLGILMEGNDPVGGQWNFDAENRKPPKSGLLIPAPFETAPDALTRDVLELVESSFPDHFGDLLPFHFATTRTDALAVLDHFITLRLPHFGTYQDAMIADDPWMFHSHISFYLNIGLLTPLECIRAAERAYSDNEAPLNAVEGFIRQILGWREFVRGLYWFRMPDYANDNALGATRALPPMFWTGQTQMNCLSQSFGQTIEWAYAHHIQRLMVIGNFALLAGLSPDEVNEWFLIVYADAFEWVELPNVTGMILFADGGVLASKPYAASGAYINRMSNYCSGCRYKVSVKNGPEACPFNYLYWNFLDQHQSNLGKNPRLGMPYRNLARMSDEKLDAVRIDSARFLKQLDAGDLV
ncbi:deoxyribodipyrimidine photolyase-related protein [Shimia isoporae]|uniref:Deoxyribodipyrimidine photolyase-related protein n=1 Tax=Shimia isoporae TaxID=647720 RepID=A0A4R1N4K7_9RHOB|nr:cryptochrome/photolyase family protein [Shimia isoporae]TCL01606.1 deoxyribodipyrimidine photolyase-related protein [Shimia isoporae]